MLLGTDLQVGTQTAYAREICKFEANYTQYGPPGRPHVHRDYPARMYKPSRSASGGPPVFEGQDADDERDRERLERLGFVYGGQGAALEALEAREFEIAELAANRAFNDQRMSPKAQAEADAADARTMQHLAEIPETPKRAPGRPRKEE
ncbi:MAG TPA: hypothetical protein VK595_13835 [Vicinamibacterales bacterium]|nr:hypothetical protein [Vicinamibacterales bacterium]